MPAGIGFTSASCSAYRSSPSAATAGPAVDSTMTRLSSPLTKVMVGSPDVRDGVLHRVVFGFHDGRDRRELAALVLHLLLEQQVLQVERHLPRRRVAVGGQRAHALGRQRLGAIALPEEPRVVARQLLP